MIDETSEGKLAEYFYRYRPLEIGSIKKSVVDELKNGELFLASLDENNDPMDGMQEVFWEGDAIVWANFVKHYLLCMLYSMSYICVAGDTASFGPDCVNPSITPDNIPTDKLRSHYNDLVNSALNDSRILELIDILSKRVCLKKSELFMVLFMYHQVFLFHLNAAAKKHWGHEVIPEPLSSAFQNPPLSFKEMFEEIEQKEFEVLSHVASTSNEELLLLTKYEHRTKGDGSTSKDNFINFISHFPIYYLDCCANSIFYEYYLASFSEKNDNPSMWGHYAQGHRGICLVFEFDETNGEKHVELINGEKLPLKQVKYRSTSQRINFFKHLGHLNRVVLDKHWLTNNEKVSYLAGYYNDSFPHRYWAKYDKKITHKFPEWKYEKEYRLVKSSWFVGPLSPEERLVRYKHRHLKGIIFGVRTPDEIQISAMKAISDLYDQGLISEDFKFYKAKFSQLKNKLEIQHLGLLKLSGKNGNA